MAKKFWLTQANAYNFKNINKPSPIVCLDPTPHGVGNTRVTIDAMQDASGEPVAFEQRKLFRPILDKRRVGDDFRTVLTGVRRRADNEPDVWSWFIPGKSSSFPTSQREIRDPDRRLPPEKANDQTWTPHGTTYQKSEFIKDFTSLFYDLAASNIGLGLDFSIDHAKIKAAFNDNFKSNPKAIDFLKITPVFNINQLTAEALEAVTVRYSNQKFLSPMFRFLTAYSTTNNSYGSIKGEHFEANLSNVLKPSGHAARTIVQKPPLFSEIGEGRISIANREFEFLSKPMLENPLHVVWTRSTSIDESVMCFGNLTSAEKEDDPYVVGSSISLAQRLSISINRKQYVLESPNPEIINKGSTQRALKDLTVNEIFEVDNSSSRRNEMILFPPGAEAPSPIFVPGASARYLSCVVHKLNDFSKRIAFCRFFSDVMTPSFLQSRVPDPFDTPRFLGNPNRKFTVTKDFDVAMNNDGVASLVDRETSRKITTDISRVKETRVLYVKSTFYVSLDALAMSLRGQKFESAYEECLKAKSDSFFQNPLVVKQDTTATLTPVTLERVFDIRNYKGGQIFDVLDEIEALLSTLKSLPRYQIPITPILTPSATPTTPNVPQFPTPSAPALPTPTLPPGFPRRA